MEMIKNPFRFTNTYTQLPALFYSHVSPTPVEAPEILAWNETLAIKMGLDFSKINFQDKSNLFSGNVKLENAKYIAQAYAGHQFGHFTLLGDGRAILWGEHQIEEGKILDIQWKGSGPTPYSRQGDGRAALGPMLREYVISEAMYYLGIPTSRSLAVVKTGEDVIREKVLPGAILTRVASSHIRVGTFEFAASQGSKKDLDALLEYSILRHYPDLIHHKDRAIAFLYAVMNQQISLLVEWMRVGFIHGVMNTDNMAISGETIDYGPCAFMDSYHPDTVFSSIDIGGRYAYKNQAKIAKWNISKLAESLLPCIHSDPRHALGIVSEVLQDFDTIYQEKWIRMMCAKLGLIYASNSDDVLVSDLFEFMQKKKADFTNTFQDLIEKPIGDLYEEKFFQDWFLRWQKRKSQEPYDSSIAVMKRVNPVIIPRNHQVQKALDIAYKGNMDVFHHLCAILQKPYESTLENKHYQLPPNPKEQVYQTFCGT